MIIDELSNIGRYACLSANFAEAVRFLSETALDSLSCGSVPVDGEQVFATLSENMTIPGERPFEAHDRYADIQVILQGRERFALGFEPSPGPLLPEKDFRPCRAEKHLAFILEPGQFVIFLPGEAHAPGGAAGDPAPCRKLIVKVLCGNS